MSLRTFHLLFILVAVLGADLVGLWGIVRYVKIGETGSLVLGVVSLLGGIGLMFYGIHAARMFDSLKSPSQTPSHR